MHDIGLNLLFVDPRMAGVRVVATNLLRALLEVSLDANDYRFRLFTTRAGLGCLLDDCSRDTVRRLGNRFETTIFNVNPARKVTRFGFEQLIFPAKLNRIRLLHSFDYTFPYRATCRHLVTIHDLNYLRYPKTFSTSQRWIRKWTVPMSVSRADHVVTVSQSAREEILREFGMDSDRLSVVHNGFQSCPLNPGSPLTPGPATPSGRYLLAIGTLRPHKNYARLIQSLVHVPEDVSLIIVGRNDGMQCELEQLAASLGVQHRLQFAGFTDRAQLVRLLRESRVFVFPSLYEGFGMPVLEAMSCGVPVVCSDLPVMREVGGSAAEYFDPQNPEQMARVICRVLSCASRREQLVRSGVQQVAQFSWEHSAGKMLDIYSRLLEDRRDHPESGEDQAESGSPSRQGCPQVSESRR